MRVLADTNVILDVVNQDPLWANWSEAKLLRCSGNVLINPIIYAELCSRASSTSEVDQMMVQLGLAYLEFSRKSLFLAAQAYRSYRQRGGAKTSPLADFFIGAQAEAEGFTVLTRDATRYQTYFPTVPLIGP